jgi:hypothetical protein
MIGQELQLKEHEQGDWSKHHTYERDGADEVAHCASANFAGSGKKLNEYIERKPSALICPQTRIARYLVEGFDLVREECQMQKHVSVDNEE